MPFYGVIRAVPHKALGIVTMAVLIVCLLAAAAPAAWTGLSGGATVGLAGVGAAHRTGVGLWVLDMTVLSLVCLLVNHAESL